VNTHKSFVWLIVALLLIVLLIPGSSFAQENVKSNKQVCSRYLEEFWNEGNFENAEALFTDDFVSHYPWGGDLSETGLELTIRNLRDGNPDTHFDVTATIAQGDYVAMVFFMKSTWTERWNISLPTNEVWTMSGIFVHRFDDGKIAEEWLLGDTFHIRWQLGLDSALSEFSIQEAWDIEMEDGAAAIEDNLSLVEDWISSFYNEPDFSLVTDEFTIHDALVFTPEAIVGHEEVQSWLASRNSAWPDFEMIPNLDTEEITIISEGELVLVLGAYQATFTVDFTMEDSDFAANDRVITVPAAELYRIEDGKLAELWIAFDTMSWFNQMARPVKKSE
jgi:predicted SnoaL-like aldol condensation-catalyzing enzyme